MRISIFGLGYVGCVGAACLAKLGHTVIGVDVNENKVRLINEGKPTIIEDGIAELCAEANAAGRMSATTDVHEAVHKTEVSFIVVGTPSSKEGHLNLNYIYAVAKQIGEALKDKELKNGGMKTLRHIVAIRSTVLPGVRTSVMNEESSNIPAARLTSSRYSPLLIPAKRMFSPERNARSTRGAAYLTLGPSPSQRNSRSAEALSLSAVLSLSVMAPPERFRSQRPPVCGRRIPRAARGRTLLNLNIFRFCP